MRFVSLALRPYGAFADAAFEFEAEEPGGFHLVHGPNGAGKSTTLRAIRSVLFGMSPKVDAHHFVSRDLRLFAHLRKADGTELRYCRRTATKSPLRDGADEEAIGEELLTPFLGGLDRGRFETLYGLDLPTMVEGGRQLLTGEGDLGRALYGAGLGGTQLAHTIDRLDDEIEELYADRSQKARINTLLREYDELTKEIKGASRSPSAFDEQRRALARARKTVQEAERTRGEVREESVGLERLARVLPAIARIDRAAATRAALDEREPLSPADVERFEALQAERATLVREQEQRAAQGRERESRQAELRATTHQDVLESAEEIRGLVGRRVAYEDALAHVAQREEEREEARRAHAAARASIPSSGGSEAGTFDAGDASAALEENARVRRDARRDLESARKEHGRASAALAAARRANDEQSTGLARELAADLAELGPFRGTLEQLEGLVPPPIEAIDERAAAEVRRRDEASKRAHAREQADEHERLAAATIERLRADAGGAPPTNDELRRVREERDACWARIAESARAAAAPEAEDTHAFPGLLAESDATADRLRAESDRSAELSAALRDRKAAGERRAEIDEAARDADERAAREDAAWDELWEPCGFTPQAAATMKAWRGRRRALVEKAAALRAEARRSLESLELEHDERAAAVSAAEAAVTESEARWTAWCARVGVDPDAGEDRARARIEAVSEAETAARDLARLEPEAARLRTLVDDFEHDAAAACDRLHVTVELPATAPKRVAALESALDAAVRAEAEIDTLDRAAARDTAQTDLAQARLTEVDEEIEGLRERTGEPTVEALGERVALSAELRKLDVEIEGAMAEVNDTFPDRTLDDVRAAIGERTAADLATEIETCVARIDEIEAVLGTAREEIGTLRGAVEGEGSAKAAELAERRARVTADLTESTEEFVRARLARELLDQEIERHRIENQGPLLRRAGDLFEVLTLGAYTGLVASEDAKGHPIMEARRTSGVSVPLTGMSSGTQDQLYLALRVASVEQMIRTTEPMPFIADDLFVNFDDDRTEAAMRVLAELARSTQVIVFSHHDGVRERAEKLDAEGVHVRVHRLPGESARTVGNG